MTGCAWKYAQFIKTNLHTEIHMRDCHGYAYLSRYIWFVYKLKLFLALLYDFIVKGEHFLRKKNKSRRHKITPFDCFYFVCTNQHS